MRLDHSAHLNGQLVRQAAGATELHGNIADIERLEVAPPFGRCRGDVEQRQSVGAAAMKVRAHEHRAAVAGNVFPGRFGDDNFHVTMVAVAMNTPLVGGRRALVRFAFVEAG